MTDPATHLEYQTPHATAEADKVSTREKIGLGLGKALVDGTLGTLYVLINPVYVITMGMSTAWVTSIQFALRIWDAMLDPYFGQVSDNFRSRWGRRLPLMFVGAIPLAVFFAAMWWFPQGATPDYLFWFLLLMSLGFATAHSLFAAPLGGLIVEATDDYHERTKIAGVTLAFGFAVQVGSNWIVPLISASFFGGVVNGARWVAIGCGALFLLAGLAPVLLCRERLYKKVAVRQKRIGFFKGLKAAADNRQFLILLIVRCIYSFSFNIVGQLHFFMFVYGVFGGDFKGAGLYLAILGSAYHVAALSASLFVYPRLERLIGKRRTLQVGAAVLVMGCLAKIFAYVPGLPMLPILVTICNGIANAGVTLMATAMLGDIADQDELAHGVRREGLFSALVSWCDKAGNSLGSFLTGFILVWIAFDPKRGGALLAIHPQSDYTLSWMRICYVAAPMIGAIATILLIQRYRVTQDEMYRIKDELAKRRAALSPTT